MRGISVLAFTFFLVGCGAAREHDTGDVDARQIAERLAAYDRANDAADLDALMTLFDDDAVMMVPDQPSVVGKPAIREVIRGWLSGRCSVRHEPMATESFGQIVIHRGNSTGSCAATESSGATTYSNKYLHIYRRQSDGSLRYWRGSFSSNAPAS
jgi:ketosteroid isomerase-like protein